MCHFSSAEKAVLNFHSCTQCESNAGHRTLPKCPKNSCVLQPRVSCTPQHQQTVQGLFKSVLQFEHHGLTRFSLSLAQSACADVEGLSPVSFHLSVTWMPHFEQTPSASAPSASARNSHIMQVKIPGLRNILMTLAGWKVPPA